MHNMGYLSRNYVKSAIIFTFDRGAGIPIEKGVCRRIKTGAPCMVQTFPGKERMTGVEFRDELNNVSGRETAR